MTGQQISALVSQVGQILWQIIGFVLVVLVAAYMLSKLGVSQRVIPILAPLELLYLAGVVWLSKGGRIA